MQRRGKLVPCKECGIYKWRCSSRLDRILTFCSRVCQSKYRKENSFTFSCLICDKKVKTQPSQIVLRSRKTCSVKCRSKLARKLAIERRLKYGYTKHQLDRLARYSPEAEAWRKEVFKRDNYTCQICNVRGGYIEADHIKPFSYFPEIRYNLLNGRTLCRKCHDSTKISAKRMKEKYG